MGFAGGACQPKERSARSQQKRVAPKRVLPLGRSTCQPLRLCPSRLCQSQSACSSRNSSRGERVRQLVLLWLAGRSAACRLNMHFIRETTTLREDGGGGSFLHRCGFGFRPCAVRSVGLVRLVRFSRCSRNRLANVRSFGVAAFSMRQTRWPRHTRFVSVGRWCWGTK